MNWQKASTHRVDTKSISKAYSRPYSRALRSMLTPGKHKDKTALPGKDAPTEVPPPTNGIGLQGHKEGANCTSP